MKRKTQPGTAYLNAGIPLGLDGRTPPTEFRIFAFGENPSEKGTFLFDQDSALSVMAAYAKHNKPMLLDYNHGTTIEGVAPEVSITAGEFVPEVRADGLWATRCTWNERAAAFLRAGEYRLFSPYFRHDDKGRVTRLINIALTNLPALDSIEPLVAASATPAKDNDMTCESCSALNAKLSAKDEELSALKTKLGALERKKEEDEEKEKASGLTMTKLTALTGQTSVPATLGAIEGWKAKAEGYDKLAAEQAAQQTATLTATIKATLDQGVKDGKIPPANRDAIEQSALKLGGGKPSADGVEFLTGLVANMPKLISTEDTQQAKPRAQLSETRLAIARQMGRKVEDIVKYETEHKTLGQE